MTQRKWTSAVRAGMLCAALGIACAGKPIEFPTLPPTAERTPPPIRAEGWEGVVINRLAVSVDAAGNCGAPFTAEAILIMDYLESLGIEVVEAGAPADAAFTALVNCEAKSESYTEAGGPLLPRSCWYAYRMHSDPVLKKDAREYWGVGVDIDQPSPSHLSPDQCARSPEAINDFTSLGPMRGRVIDRLRREIAAFWAEVWGPNVFAWFIYDEASGQVPPEGTAEEAYVARDLLRQMGPDGLDAVPTLIAMVANGWGGQDILKSITGEDFGENSAAWLRWWEKQQ